MSFLVISYLYASFWKLILVHPLWVEHEKLYLTGVPKLFPLLSYSISLYLVIDASWTEGILNHIHIHVCQLSTIEHYVSLLFMSFIWKLILAHPLGVKHEKLCNSCVQKSFPFLSYYDPITWQQTMPHDLDGSILSETTQRSENVAFFLSYGCWFRSF